MALAVKKKTSASKSGSGSKKSKVGAVVTGIGHAASSLLGSGKGKSGGHRRRRGPTYWANKALTEKFKRRYMRLKYGR